MGSLQPDIEVWAAIKEVEDKDEPRILAMAADEASGVQAELCNSGASHHMSLYCEHFAMYQQINPCPITAANNCVFYAIGAGDLLINVQNGTESTKAHCAMFCTHQTWASPLYPSAVSSSQVVQ